MLIKKALRIPTSAAHFWLQSPVGNELRLRPLLGTALLRVTNPMWVQ